MKNRKLGFSLIEVNMAVLVVGIGILVLFGIFPSGLREGENGIIDTHCALFAETVLEGLRGEAHNNSNLLDWDKWKNINTCASNLKLTLPGGTIFGETTILKKQLSVRGSIEFPVGADPKTYIHYILQIRPGSTDFTRTVNLWVYSGEYVTKDPIKFIAEAEWYSTKYFYGDGI